MAVIDVPRTTLFGFPHRELMAGEQRSIVAFGATVQSAFPRRAGAELGPAAIREMSREALETYLSSPSRTAVDLNSGRMKRLRNLQSSSDLGDLECDGPVSSSHVAQIAEISAATRRSGSMPVLLGGDQRLFEGLVKGVQDGAIVPPILSISDKLSLPAATDSAPLALADVVVPANNSCPLLCVGVNGLQSSAAWEAMDRVGGSVVSADQIYDTPNQVRETIKRFIHSHKSLVCCVDLETLDAGHAAGTPALNVGGLTPEQLISMLSDIIPSGALSGVALTNVAPSLDARGLTELAAVEALMAVLDGELFTEITE